VGMDPEEVLEDEALPNLQDAEESDMDSDDDDDEGVDENGRHPDESDDEDDPINDIYLDSEDFFEAYVFEGTGANGRPIPIRCPDLDQITTQQGNDTSDSSRRGPNVSPPSGAPETQAPRPGKEREAPTLVLAKQALEDLQKLLQPPRDKGYGYKDPGLDPYVRARLEGMRSMLNFYVNPQSQTVGAWGASSCQAAISLMRGRHCACQLRALTQQYIKDRKVLPLNPYGNWNKSMLVDKDLVNEISLYLQEIGKEISAKKLMEFISRPDIKEKYCLEKPISERTARRYLNNLGY